MLLLRHNIQMGFGIEECAIGMLKLLSSKGINDKTPRDQNLT